MRILVTGGAGFIGSHVVDRLVARRHEVIIYDNLDSQVHGAGARLPDYLQRHVDAGATRFILGDVRNAFHLKRALEGTEAVVHLAAAVGVGQSMYEPSYYTDTNLHGTGVLLEQIAALDEKPRRLVVASSMSIYGEGAYRCEVHGTVTPGPRSEAQLQAGTFEVRCTDCDHLVRPRLTREDKPLQATSIYAITKKTQEEMSLCFGTAYDIPTTALRFFNVYGSRQSMSNPYTGVAAIFMSRLKNRKPPVIFEDGAQSRDFIHVSDVADAVVRATEAPPRIRGTFNICTGERTRVADVADILAEQLGLNIRPDVVGQYRAGDIRHCIGDPSRARDELGFVARTTFMAGIQELLDWASTRDAEDRVATAVDALKRHSLVR